jgi:P27 family predicted phage terminase small subunit
MGRRGPAPLPTAIKLLHGERRAQRLNRAEPRPRRALPRRPADLSAAAQAVWRRVIREVGASGVITAADRDILRAYCEAVARYEYAAITLEQSGPLVRGARRGELVKNPLHQIVRDNADLIRLLSRELGLSPAARSGLRAVERPVDTAFEEYLARGRRRAG